MIIVKLIGGLGNQLFQYAAGRQLAELNSTILKLDISGFEEYKLHRYALHSFEIWQHIATIEEIEAFKKVQTKSTALISKIGKRLNYSINPTLDFYRNVKVINESNLMFNSDVLELKGNIYMNGYWQSERYFSDIRNILLKEFTIKHKQDFTNLELSKQICNTESVSLHIRRGDYISSQLTNQIHGVCSMEYYQKAINEIVKKISNCHFYIFSDDHHWVRENFRLDYPMTMVDNNTTTNYEDIRLMSQCRHNIIANSSFSWWGAWLNTNSEKIVIAPKKWFADDVKNKETKYLVPETWIRI
jgi:hypothetical protein